MARLIEFNNILSPQNNFATSLHNRNSCLELFQYITANGREFEVPIDFDEGKAKYNILLAVLDINSKINDRSITKYEEARSEMSDDSLLHYQISTNLELHDQINFRVAEYHTQTFKLFYLTKFLGTNTKITPHFRWFLAYFQCYNMLHFIHNMLELIEHIQQANEQNYFTFEIHPDNRNLINFVARFIRLTGFTEKSVDFVDLKEHPLIHKSENKFQVVFVRYCYDKLFKSLYFLFDDINENLPERDKDSNFRQTFSTDFTELFLCSTILKDVLSPEGQFLADADIKQILTEQKNLKKGISPSLPDFYFGSENDIFFFELKDALIAGDLKSTNTIHEIIEFLTDRFNFLSEDRKKKKGIPQLVGYIEDLLSGKYPYTNIKGIENVYSILLLTDDIYNTLGINYLLNSWYQKRVDELLSLEVKNSVNIQPLCVVTIDTLILYSYFFENNIISLSQLIKDYVKECLPNDSKIENVYPPTKKHIPFSSYLQNRLIADGHLLDELSLMHILEKAMKGI